MLETCTRLNCDIPAALRESSKLVSFSLCLPTPRVKNILPGAFPSTGYLFAECDNVCAAPIRSGTAALCRNRSGPRELCPRFDRCQRQNKTGTAFAVPVHQHSQGTISRRRAISSLSFCELCVSLWPSLWISAWPSWLLSFSASPSSWLLAFLPLLCES